MLGDGGDEDPDADNLLTTAAKPVPVEDLSVSADEMEEFANKLHDKAGASAMFTEDDQSRVQL